MRDIRRHLDKAWRPFPEGREVEAIDRERLELAERFGGRIEFILDHAVERGLLTEHDATGIKWKAQSRYWLVEGASDLEAVVRRF